MAKVNQKMLTVREVAARINAGESSVRLWAKDGKFVGAELVESPVGSYWVIPETALEGFVNPGRGRPPKPTEAAPTANGTTGTKATASKKPAKKAVKK